MNALDKLLIEEISLAERERDQCEAKIKGLNQKILDYRTALNHARDSDFSLNKKTRNIRFQSSPRQLVAHIFKKQPEKWFHTNEITLQALKLDNQSTDNGVSRLHLQTIHSTLNHLMKHSLVEKKLEGKICYWRLQAR